MVSFPSSTPSGKSSRKAQACPFENLVLLKTYCKCFQIQATPDLGQKCQKRTHQKNNWPWYLIICAWDHGNQCVNQLHQLPLRCQEDPCHQAAFPCYDYQERKWIFSILLLLKQLKKYFTFEVQVLDDKNVRRRFRASNYQSTTRVKPFICTMPMRLDEGWNQIQFNLSDFTRRAYGTNYIETLR